MKECFSFLVLKIYLLLKQSYIRERQEEEREINSWVFNLLVPLWNACTDCGWLKLWAGSSVWCPTRVAGTQSASWAIACCCPRCALTETESKAEPALEPVCSDTGCRPPKQVLTTAPSTCFCNVTWWHRFIKCVCYELISYVKIYFYFNF